LPVALLGEVADQLRRVLESGRSVGDGGRRLH
jgi:hypothetical protein